LYRGKGLVLGGRGCPPSIQPACFAKPVRGLGWDATEAGCLQAMKKPGSPDGSIARAGFRPLDHGCPTFAGDDRWEILGLGAVSGFYIRREREEKKKREVGWPARKGAVGLTGKRHSPPGPVSTQLVSPPHWNRALLTLVGEKTSSGGRGLVVFALGKNPLPALGKGWALKHPLPTTFEGGTKNPRGGPTSFKNHQRPEKIRLLRIPGPSQAGHIAPHLRPFRGNLASGLNLRGGREGA